MWCLDTRGIIFLHVNIAMLFLLQLKVAVLFIRAFIKWKNSQIQSGECSWTIFLSSWLTSLQTLANYFFKL